MADCFRFLRIVGLLCFASCVQPLWARDEAIAMIETDSQVYSNVTLISKSPTHVFIKHSRGFSGLKINELSHEVLAKLGLRQGAPPPAASFRYASAPLASIGDSFKESPLHQPVKDYLARFDLEPKITQTEGRILIEIHGESFVVDHNLIKGLLACLGFGYVLFCYCAMLICRKSGLKAGFSCWLPFIQLIQLLRAAGMSGWLILLCLFPLFNLIVSIIWCFKISRARGKGGLTVLFLLLPITNVLAFLYLALSTDGKEEEARSGKLHLSYQH